MWSWYQEVSYLGGRFSHLEGNASVSGSRIFGYYFSGQNDKLVFVMGRDYPLSEIV